MNAVQEEVMKLFKAFGMTLDMYRFLPENELYLKYRFYPAESSKSNGMFQKVVSCVDTFFDEMVNSDVTFSNGKIGKFYRSRRRVEDAESLTVAIDNTSQFFRYVDTPVHDVTSSCNSTNLAPFLSYTFTRYKSEAFENVYMDCLDSSELREYTVITISKKLSSIDDAMDAVTEILKTSLLLEHNALPNSVVSDYLYDKNIMLNPTYSKFMFIIQLSEYFEEYYDVFAVYDPAKECTEERVDIVSESTENPCYCKDYLWAIDVQIHYFQCLLQHSKNKKNNVRKFLEHVKEYKRKVAPSLAFIHDDSLCC